MDPLRVGLVGYGGHGPLFQKIVKGKGPQVLATIVAVADTRDEALTKAQVELAISAEHCYRHAAPLLTHENPDILVVAIPPTSRYEVITALNSKVPVFCENPLSAYLDDAHAICRHQQSNLCCVDEQWPRLPQVIQMQQLIRDNYIGRLRCVRIGGKGRQAKVEIARIGTHLFNVAHKFTGNFRSCVAAEGGSGDDIIAVFDTALRLPIYCEFLCATYNVGRCYIQLDGTAGRLRATGGLLEHLIFSPVPYDSVAEERSEPGKAWKNLPFAPNTWPIREGMAEKALSDPFMNPTWQLWEEFVTFVRGQGENPFPPQRALPAVEAMDLIWSSLGLHTPVMQH